MDQKVEMSEGQMSDHECIKSVSQQRAPSNTELYTLCIQAKRPATEDLFSTESLHQSRVAPGMSSNWAHRRAPMTTATHTWGRDVWCRRRVDGRPASSASDETGQCIDRGHPWRCAVHGRHTGIRPTRIRPGHDRAHRTSAQRSRLSLSLSAGMAHSPRHTHTKSQTTTVTR